MSKKEKDEKTPMELIDEIIRKTQDAILVDKEKHTYVLKRTGKELLPVSRTLTYFSSIYESIPADVLANAQLRGNVIHNVIENVFNHWRRSGRLLTDKEIREFALLDIRYVEEQVDYSLYLENFITWLNNGWRSLLENEPRCQVYTEFVVYDAKTSIAGTVDLMIVYQGIDITKVWIIDYKTGSIQISNYAQLGIYHGLVKQHLNKIPNIQFDTEIISFKELDSSIKTH